MLVSFRHLPLTRIHPQAWRAAEAAECAAAQGKFWEMHDEVFAAQGDLSDAGLLRVASRAGVREGLYEACMADGSSSARVSEDAELGR
jgi:protein-disulfide isomerase